MSGSGNTQVSVRGRDFPPGARVELHLAVPLTGSTPGSFSAADVAADGQFETAFVMPSAWPNGSSIDEPDLEVVAITADGTVSASARFAFDPAGAITQRYQPLAIAECDPLRDAIESALAAGTTTRAVQPFATASGSIGGEGCVLLVHGDGGDLDGFVPTAMAMRDVLLAHGWSEDLAFAAGGPTGLEWRSGSMTA